MGKYLFKRILYSIFSVICIMIIMMFLLFTLKDRNVIVSNDPTLTKLTGNEKEYKKTILLEKYNYIKMIDYSSWMSENYSKKLLPGDYATATTLPVDPNPEAASDTESENVKIARSYIAEYQKDMEKQGYTVVYLKGETDRYGEIKDSYDPRIYAIKDESPFVRVWNFFSSMIKVETLNDVENITKELGYVYETGYYLTCERNEWENYDQYWGGFDFKLKKNEGESDYENNKICYRILISVDESDLNADGKFEYNIVYFNAETGTKTKIFEENKTITGKGQFRIDCFATFTDAGNSEDKSDPSNATFSTKIRTVTDEVVADTYYTKGGVYPIENKGISLVWDSYSNMPALVGNGTTHQYLVYFDDQFPFVHQNIIKLNLGTSISGPTAGKEVMSLMFSNKGQGKITSREVEYPAFVGTGCKSLTADDFHTATYFYGSESVVNKDTYARYGSRYYSVDSLYSDMPRVGFSFILGIFSTFFAYIIGIPLGILMARKKDKLADKLGMAYIIFMIAVPSLAYIFIFSSIGQACGFPVKFGQENVNPAWLVYVLPIISLTLPSIGGEMKWVRRYMIDQENSDYVKFARSQGLSEGEIFTKHISKNAIIPIVHGIPGAIIGCLSGAFVTEKVYGVPGTGGLLTDSINRSDNTMILGLTFFYSILSITSLILGDILLTVVDPRISFTGGRK